MTQEEKAKAYDESLERARNLHKDAIDMEEGLLAKQCEIIFPELKESEDERIRKCLLRFHKSTIDIDGIKGDEIVSWLEKQGQKPAWTEEDSMIQNGIILDGVVYELTTGFPDNKLSLCGNCELNEKCIEFDGSLCYFFADNFRKVFRKVKMERKL